MKILFATNSLDYGGIEINLVLLCQEFTKRGHGVFVAARPGPLVGKVEAAGARFVPLSSRLRNPLGTWKDAGALARLIRSEAPDIIHVFSATAATQVRLALARLRFFRPKGFKRAVRFSSIMGLVNSPDESRLRVHFRDLLTILGSDAVLLISPAIEANVQQLRIKRRQLIRQHVVGIRPPDPASIGPRARQSLRKRLGVRPDQPLVATIGRLTPRKSHELFLQSARLVADRHPEARFVIVGDGPLRPALERLIQDLRLDRHVRLVGDVDNVYPYYAAADLYMRPGVVEGFIGITVLEAQAVGRPVLAFETEDVRLAIEHGRTGLLVPRGDVRAMAEAMCDLIESKEKSHRIGDQGREHVRRTFLIDIIARDLEALYDKATRREFLNLKRADPRAVAAENRGWRT